ncbi:putative very-long-chain acyl-CoA synthetase [Aspergillus clavatus NRRL 1]|uniref:Very-long-chain acyl-CoA synthetase, putative n=1 Tax=Aspergillus clavatus (strain ATCC 1007 / CBS 513.65 / DSM 816 / NCTC 3887 / NRRL 1 / QM 1276 / 107) TaxID=344612 RepID=A1CCK6_ASPCL|nr:very-long-chain acyl-CoA synthetase, putative [Aspergillus clavatus NRRL 1]EAW12263.1 very-long-chain acyl-CoA synthetase, putative [Aspergillus clavatus NRRL 1]
MDLATVATTVAGTAVVAAYLDAKWHITKDVQYMWRVKAAEKAAAQEGQCLLGSKCVKPNLTSIIERNGQICPFYEFEKNVQKYPDHLAIWSQTGQYTFKELYEHVCQYANYFHQLGVQRGQLVAFYLTNSPEFIMAWFALLSIGSAPAAINYNLTGDALIHCLKVCGVNVLLADEDVECRGRIDASRSAIEGKLGMKILSLDESLKSHIATFPRSTPPEDLRRNLPGDAPFVLLFTSGTTGMPKAYPFSQRRFHPDIRIHRFLNIESQPGPEGDCWYNCMPLYHGTGGFMTMVALCSGTSVAIAKRFSATSFWKDIHESKATWFVYVGEVVRYLLNQPASPYDRDHRLRGMYGNGLRLDVWEKFRERFNVPDIVEFFGSSEGLDGLITRRRLNRTLVPIVVDHDSGSIVRDPKTGLARTASYEEGGEIVVGVPSTTAWKGYWQNASATDKKFARDILKIGDVFYRTGDALRRTPDGRWYFMDRLGDTFRWKSENVSTTEVAEALSQFPGVMEANVYGVLVPHHEGRAGCAALQMSEGIDVDLMELARFARSKLPRYAVPAFIRLVRTSSHIHNYKQNKVPLREEGVDPRKKGSLVEDGVHDTLFYLSPGAEAYVEFGQREWDDLVAERVKL